MKHDIQISVLGIQDAGSGPEAILTKAFGAYDFENGIHKISYCELDETAKTEAALILTAMNAAHRLARWLLRFFADNPFLQFLQFLWLPAGNREFFQ